MKTPLPNRHAGSVGLTLTELLVAVAIIIVLAGFLIPTTNCGSGASGRLSESLNNAKQISLALRMYAEDHGGNFPSLRSDGQPFAPGDFSNQALEQLMPEYCSSKAVFLNRDSAWCKERAGDAGPVDADRLRRGQNDWIYVTGLKRESDPNWPLIATATASATDLTYKHSTKTKGGVWEGKAAIIVHVDGSARRASELKTDPKDKTRSFPARNDTGTNIFVGTPEWLGIGRLILAPE